MRFMINRLDFIKIFWSVPGGVYINEKPLDRIRTIIHIRPLITGQTVQTGERTQTDGQTDKRMDRGTDATKYIISLTLRPIIISMHLCWFRKGLHLNLRFN